jgi:hypothetical protein
MHEWLHEVPHSILHVDSGFFRTIVRLTTQSGEAIREYLAGKRKSLFSPFLYVLIMCGVFVVAHHFLVPKPAAGTAVVTTMKDAQAYIEANYYKVLVVAMILPMTIATFLAYFRSGFNFAEHLALNAYVIGQLVIADVLMMLISLTSLNREQQPAVYHLIEFVLKFPYWFIAYWRFFRPSKWYFAVLQFIFAQIVMGLILFGLLTGAAAVVLKLKGP